MSGLFRATHVELVDSIGLEVGGGVGSSTSEFSDDGSWPEWWEEDVVA